MWFSSCSRQLSGSHSCIDPHRCPSLVGSLVIAVAVQLLSRVWLFCDSTNCSPPGSSVGVISQAVTRVSISPPRDHTRVSYICRRILYHWANWEAWLAHWPSFNNRIKRNQWVFPVHQARALVSCIQPGLVTCFTLDNIYVSMLFFQNVPPSPSPTESKILFCTSVSLFLFCI